MSSYHKNLKSVALSFAGLLAIGTSALAGEGLFGTGIPNSMEQLRNRIGSGSEGIVLQRPHAESSYRFGVDPQVDVTRFVLANGTGRTLWFQLSFEDPRRGFQTFREWQIAQPGQSISWKARVAGIKDVRIVGRDSTTGQTFNWNNVRYNVNRTSNDEMNYSLTEHRSFRLTLGW